MSYLCCCVKYIESELISKDSIYFYSYKIDNYDKEGSYFKYFSFIENIGITFIKKTKEESYGITYIFDLYGEIKGSGYKRVKYSNKNKLIDSHKLVFKYKYKDKYINKFEHTLRFYSNGVVIHSSKLFKFIYRIDDNGFIIRKPL
jgi:hypothetical protein